MGGALSLSEYLSFFSLTRCDSLRPPPLRLGMNTSVSLGLLWPLWETIQFFKLYTQKSRRRRSLRETAASSIHAAASELLKRTTEPVSSVKRSDTVIFISPLASFGSLAQSGAKSRREEVGALNKIIVSITASKSDHKT